MDSYESCASKRKDIETLKPLVREEAKAVSTNPDAQIYFNIGKKFYDQEDEKMKTKALCAFELAFDEIGHISNASAEIEAITTMSWHMAELYVSFGMFRDSRALSLATERINMVETIGECQIDEYLNHGLILMSSGKNELYKMAIPCFKVVYLFGAEHWPKQRENFPKPNLEFIKLNLTLGLRELTRAYFYIGEYEKAFDVITEATEVLGVPSPFELDPMVASYYYFGLLYNLFIGSIPKEYVELTKQRLSNLSKTIPEACYVCSLMAQDKLLSSDSDTNLSQQYKKDGQNNQAKFIRNDITYPPYVEEFFFGKSASEQSEQTGVHTRFYSPAVAELHNVAELHKKKKLFGLFG